MLQQVAKNLEDMENLETQGIRKIVKISLENSGKFEVL